VSSERKTGDYHNTPYLDRTIFRLGYVLGEQLKITCSKGRTSIEAEIAVHGNQKKR